MSNAINNNGAVKVSDSVTDAKTMLEASDKEAKKKAALEAKKAAILKGEELTKAEEKWEELDYSAVDSINQAMLIMVGERVDHTENVKGLCAIGRVELQVGGKRLMFGTMTRQTLQINTDTMAFLFDCGFSSEQILEVSVDAKKAWCLGDKVTKAKDKETRDRAKKQSKVDRQKAILDKLKGK